MTGSAPGRGDHETIAGLPFGLLTPVLVAVGLVVSLAVNAWVGIAIMLVGLGFGIANALGPWRRGETDLWGRRRSPGGR